jgi:hypothetical protein
MDYIGRATVRLSDVPIRTAIDNSQYGDETDRHRHGVPEALAEYRKADVLPVTALRANIIV